ncbi:MAG TPA: hypothetical protein VKZ53_30880 [Candidatus Angelobacter sp.]|nr:hypothetical protein [Candidatus Angelobacter sp.]
MARSCFWHFSYLFLFCSLLFCGLAFCQANSQPSSQAAAAETTYFIDVVGPEYDPEEEAAAARAAQKIAATNFLQATLSQSLRNDWHSWRLYLRNDGTWAPGRMGKRDYGLTHYPVEYVLPFGYRGGFRVVWGVPGAPPLQLVDGKLEVYIPASGVYQTSSPLPLTNGAVASPEHQFYFEDQGKRTVIPHEPLRLNEIGVIMQPDHCPEKQAACDNYWLGSPQEAEALKRAKCPTREAMAQVYNSGHSCDDVEPGSTQPVAELIPPKGTPALMVAELRGRTLNGRPVVFSSDASGAGWWRYDGPEPDVPDEPTLARELKAYLRVLSSQDPGPAAQDTCSHERLKTVVRAALDGPYRFSRTPFGVNVVAAFIRSGNDGSRAVYDGLTFTRGPKGWKLIHSNCGSGDSRSYESLLKLKTVIAPFAGLGGNDAQRFILRTDGTWWPDDPRVFEQPEYSERSFTGYDINGNDLLFVVDGRFSWSRVSERPLTIHTATVLAELNRTLDKYIELLSSGNVEGFLDETGQESFYYGSYKKILELGDNSQEASAIYDYFRQGTKEDEAELIRITGGSDFKDAVKRFLHDGANREVDVPSLLLKLQRLRQETPRISSPEPFSPDFEAVYAPQPGEADGCPNANTITGHGSKWKLNPGC